MIIWYSHIHVTMKIHSLQLMPFRWAHGLPRIWQDSITQGRHLTQHWLKRQLTGSVSGFLLDLHNFIQRKHNEPNEQKSENRCWIPTVFAHLSLSGYWGHIRFGLKPVVTTTFLSFRRAASLFQARAPCEPWFVGTWVRGMLLWKPRTGPFPRCSTQILACGIEEFLTGHAVQRWKPKRVAGKLTLTKALQMFYTYSNVILYCLDLQIWSALLPFSSDWYHCTLKCLHIFRSYELVSQMLAS